MDAVVLYCEENGIDPSNVKPLINKHLKEKIAYEAQSLNMLKTRQQSYQFKKENIMLEIIVAAYVIAIVGGVLINAAGI